MFLPDLPFELSALSLELFYLHQAKVINVQNYENHQNDPNGLSIQLKFPADGFEMIEVLLPGGLDNVNRFQVFKPLTDAPVSYDQVDGQPFIFIFIGRRLPFKLSTVLSHNGPEQVQRRFIWAIPQRVLDVNLKAIARGFPPFV